MIARRQFITLLGGAAATWPAVARGQQGERVRRIGLLSPFSSSHTAVWNVFRQRMEELGWKAGTNVQFEYRWANGDLNRLRTLADELVALKPDAVLTVGTPSTIALHEATQTIPIVFVNANDPVGSGFVASLARPGGNVTGFVSFEPAIGGKWLELLKEIAPHLSRVALLYNPDTHTGQHFTSIEVAARALSISAVRAHFRSETEIENTLLKFSQEARGGLLVLPDISTTGAASYIVGAINRFRLPAIFPYRNFVDAGGLAYYGTNPNDLFRQAASYVERILRGETPSDLPVQAPTRYELIINLKAAKAVGLQVPPMLLTRADEVIE